MRIYANVKTITPAERKVSANGVEYAKAFGSVSFTQKGQPVGEQYLSLTAFGIAVTRLLAMMNERGNVVTIRGRITAPARIWTRGDGSITTVLDVIVDDVLPYIAPNFELPQTDDVPEVEY